MIAEFNNEKYRVCLDVHLDENRKWHAYAIELAETDGEGGSGFGVETVMSAHSKGKDMDAGWHISTLELQFFDDLEEAKQCFDRCCSEYSIPE